MDRLEAVADVGQRARHDHAHRVVEVAGPHLVLDADRPDVAQVVGHGRIYSCRIREAAVASITAVARGGWPDRAARRSGRRSRPRPRWTGRRGACGCPPRRVAELGGRRGVELRERVADDPGPVAVVGRGGPLGLGAQGARRRGAVDDRQRAVGPRERLLDVRLGVADELAEERERACRDVGVASAPAVDVGHRRDRRADEAALPARRGVDELLELRPAVRLGGDALAVRVGERVDRDPVARLAGGAAQELPGALGLAGERPLEEAEGEPAGLELVLAEQAVGDEQERRRRGRARVASRNPRWTAARSGQRTPWTAPIPGATRCCPARYSGSARRRRPAGQGGRERVGIVRMVGEAMRRGPRPARGGRRRRRPPARVAALWAGRGASSRRVASTESAGSVGPAGR